MDSEQDLIAQLRARFPAPGASLGIGDDAAVLEAAEGPTLFCSDLMVENTHFRRDTHPPEAIGYKAIAVNVSDIGAMGGTPRCCVLSLGLPQEVGSGWVDRLLSGVERGCRELGVFLVGGDTALCERILLNVAMIGSVAAGGHVTRSGAKPGDRIYVTGTLGLAARGLTLLNRSPSDLPTDPAILRHLYPAPRHRVGRALAGRATAMIDVSDGLSKDLGHIVAASGVSARVDARRIPRAPEVSLEGALHGGEDYELLATGRDLPAELEGIGLTEIGEIIPPDPDAGIWLVGDSGQEALPDRTWRHFG
jgi:thiamine-monophosphate kinase